MRKEKIKVLMVTPYLPYPPFSGGQTRSFNLIKHLVGDCQITLASFILPDQSVSQMKELKKYCRRILTIERGKTWTAKKIFFAGLSPYPLLVANYFSPQMRRLIAQEIKKERYDLVHVECFYLMPNIPTRKVPVVLVDQTIEFAVYQHYVDTLKGKLSLLRPLLKIDVAKIKFWETYFWKKADCLVAVSKDDQRLMEKIAGRKVDLVLNGVDDRFLQKRKVKKYSLPTVLFGVANFKWIQNKEGVVNLLKYVWPLIKKEVPEARLYIAGKYSREFLSRAGFRENEAVRFGEVENPEEVYRRSWILVAPMGSGGGSRTKFFEAMACGLPVVTTPEGIEGIEAKNNREVIVRNNFSQLAQAAVELLRNPQKAAEIGEKGRELVARKYSWKESTRHLLKIYQKVKKLNPKGENNEKS